MFQRFRSRRGRAANGYIDTYRTIAFGRNGIAPHRGHLRGDCYPRRIIAMGFERVAVDDAIRIGFHNNACRSVAMRNQRLTLNFCIIEVGNSVNTDRILAKRLYRNRSDMG